MGWLKTRNDHRERISTPTDLDKFNIPEGYGEGIKKLLNGSIGSLAMSVITSNCTAYLPDLTTIGTYVRNEGYYVSNSNYPRNTYTPFRLRYYDGLQIIAPKLRSIGDWSLPVLHPANAFRKLRYIGCQSFQYIKRESFTKITECANLPSIIELSSGAFGATYYTYYASYYYYGVVLGPNLVYMGEAAVHGPYNLSTDQQKKDAAITFLGYTPPTCAAACISRTSASLYIYIRKSALSVAYGGTYEGSDGTKAFDLAPNLTSYKSYMKPYLYACTLYDEDHNTCMGPLIRSINGEAFVAPIAPTKTGYTFDGWFNEADDILYVFDTIPTGDINLYAKWTEVEE